MSYILDALRRADAQRTRELLPGAGATPTRVVFADTQPYRRGLPWPAIAVTCALLLAGFVAWHFWPASAPASPAAVVQPAAPAATPVVVQPTTPAIAQTAPAAAAPTATSPATPSTTAPASPTAVAPPASAAAPSTPGARATAAIAGISPASPALPTPAAPPAAARVPLLDELPASLRAELPKLAITGSAYSDNAAMRLLIVNGQVLHEKDEAAAGLVLEQIQPRAAVLRYKGQRFQIPY